MKIIYTSLLKQYTQKIHFHINTENIKNIIKSSKFFKINNKFNLNKYLNFLNSIELTNAQYLSALKNKNSVKSLILLLLKSEIFLEKYVHKIMNQHLEKRNVQIGSFNSSLTDLEKKIPFKDIKNYYVLNKKIFFIQKE
nr:SurA N-terminal domain-containing protein [Buchnera aphidicola]